MVKGMTSFGAKKNIEYHLFFGSRRTDIHSEQRGG